MKILSALEVPGMMLTAGLVFAFLGAIIANMLGLATIVGAYAFGLILEDIHFQSFNETKKLEEFLEPLTSFFVPIFFVLTGMQINWGVFSDSHVLASGLTITAVAIIGKIVSGWAFTENWRNPFEKLPDARLANPEATELTKTSMSEANLLANCKPSGERNDADGILRRGSPTNRLLIGFGMIPRGEVGLIFATMGKSLGIVDDKLYAITVIMVIVTTLISPPLLSYIIHKDAAD
jgi:Kef-type K+ transport system membrane component KefB